MPIRVQRSSPERSRRLLKKWRDHREGILVVLVEVSSIIWEAVP